MNILFICKWNVGRSQMAEELFNKYSKNNKGISAGTNAIKYKGKKLKEFAPPVIAVLKEKDIDVSEKIPLQLTPEIVKSVDRIVVLTKKEDLPDYLINSNKVTFWKIEDGKGKGYDFHINMRNQIEKLINKLVHDVG